MENSKNNKTPIIAAIITAGLLIAGAIIYTKLPSKTQTADVSQPFQEQENKNQQAAQIWDIIEPINQNDHVLGNPDAELTLVLYFDINCFHCRKFHETIHQLMEEYGKNGQLKWVSRHFPLNPVSQKEAEATECVAELGNNEKFWDYLDNLVSMPHLSQENLVSELTKLAVRTGINKNEFEECLESGKYTEKIKTTSQEAMGLGANGTPFSVIIDPNGKAAPIPGALTYEQMKEAIEIILESL